MRIGVYVGSFNPVHKGHKHVIDFLIENNYVDKVIVIPTQNYWDKHNLIDIEDRINMLKFYGNENIIINDTLNNYEYTYQILRQLEGELYLIIGSDNIEKFHLWKNIDEILNYKIIVLKRDDINVLKYIEKFKNKDNFIIPNEYVEFNVSSTEIRRLINSKSKAMLSKYMDSNVLKYIYDNNLYIDS